MHREETLSRRHRQIMEELASAGMVRVEKLSSMLHVSPITIRRDLDWLKKRGLLERIHGGALPLENRQGELTFNQRETLQIEEKMAIGKEAANYIEDRAIIFINSGSTSLEVIRHLLHRNVQVITNNVDSIQLLSSASHVPLMDLIIIGGQYRCQSHSLTGDMALASISDIYSSYTVLSANGIHPEYGLTHSWHQHVSLHKRMIENCRGKIIVVADSSKINIISNFVCALPKEVDILVTDSGIQDESVKRFKEIGIEVRLSAGAV